MYSLDKAKEEQKKENINTQIIKIALNSIDFNIIIKYPIISNIVFSINTMSSLAFK